jgi:tripartite-type tricarboxylate transporter receptor subunit TctC
MKRWMQSLVVVLVLAAVLPAARSADPVQNYPIRPVRIITGSPGSTSDLGARFVAQKLTERWRHQVVVDNRVGAGGIIGAEIAARSAPDGQTLIIGHIGTHVSAQSLYKNLAYDPIKDFEPITNMVASAILLVVHLSVPASNLKELLAYVKTKPAGVNYSTPGGGTSGNLTGELFKQLTGANLVHVPYKGAGFAVTSVASGETQVSFLATSTAMPQIRAGRIKPLAVLQTKRFIGIPDVPTSAEQGFPNLDSNVWFGLFAPAKTPKSIIMKINHDAVAVLRSQDARDALLALGAEPVPMSPEEFAAFVQSEITKWTKVIKAAGIKAQ